MATPSAGFNESPLQLAVALLSERQTAARARLCAQHLTGYWADSAVTIYTVDADEEAWIPRASAGDIKLDLPQVPLEGGTLGALLEKREPLLFAASDLAREDYSHLNVRRSFQSLVAIPLVHEDSLLGAVEIVSYTAALTEEDLERSSEALELTTIALAAALGYEGEYNTKLRSIARLTELYDLELVFNSTLEMDALFPLITSKIQQLTNTQAVNLWMIEEGETLLLVNRSGVDPTVQEGARQTPGQGIAADVADSGESAVLALFGELGGEESGGSPNAANQKLAARNKGVETEAGAIFSLMVAPVVHGGAVVGALEVINRFDGAPFDEDDLFLLTTICEAAAVSLYNASLMNAERKAEILETLVKLSTEITSTLNLERVLTAIVNGTQNIIPYERGAICLERNGRLQLKAVSGETEVNQNDENLKRLRELLEWSSISGKAVLISRHGGVIDDPREETRAKFEDYFEKSGMNSFYALPLADDQGRVGILSLESRDPDFLHDVHLEIIKVLAGQATVALRNAELYRDVPFIGVLEPILQRKNQFMSMQKRKRTAALWLAAAAATFMVVVPLPMRVDGAATVSTARTALVQPAVDGVVSKVYVREGDAVTRGTILAEMEDWDYRAALAAARMKQATANAEMNRALSANDSSEAGRQRINAEYWGQETARAQQRLDHTRLRSTGDGIVATPNIETFAGRKLAAGDAFAEVADTRRATVDLNVDEKDISLLQPGAASSVKLEGFPTRTFKGRVVVLSPTSHAEGEERSFYARIEVPNEDGAMRSGMQGRAKVFAGWRPAGYVLFRRPAMWVWSTLWSWFGW